jgi:NADH-quinone oxidoreductase subunit A
LLTQYIPVLVAVLVAGFIGLTFLAFSVFFGPRSDNPNKSKPFECGQDQVSSPGGRFNVSFYLVAALFIVFDVEIAFLYPWAVYYRQLGLFGVIELFIFAFFLLAGLAWAWRMKALDWN